MTQRIGAALLVTLSLEVPIASLFYPGERVRMALACALATTATNLAMNAGLIYAASSYDDYLLLGELGATVLEALVYVAVDRRHDFGRCLIASGVANAVSFIAGLLLW